MECIKLARDEIAKEVAYVADRIERYLSLALHRMRTGYRKAERRFGHGAHSNDMYRAVKEAVAGVIPSIEYAGQTFRLGYGDGEAICFEIMATSSDY